VPGRHPAEFLPPVLHRQREWGGGDHYSFEVFDIAGAQPYRLSDGFVLPDSFRADGWNLTLDPAWMASPGRRARRRHGWRELGFYPIYVVISEWRPKSAPDSFQEPAHARLDHRPMEGQIQLRTGKLDIAEKDLRAIGMFAYQYQFLPLLEYARQFPPFVNG